MISENLIVGKALKKPQSVCWMLVFLCRYLPGLDIVLQTHSDHAVSN
jgi:hypothetical protein